MSAQKATYIEPGGLRRSALSLRKLSLLLVFIGIFVSGYLSYAKLTDSTLVCAGGQYFNCDLVENSAYSRFLGIPVGFLGFGTYLLLALILVFEGRTSFLSNYGISLFFGVNLFAFLYSIWLVYAQVVILQALCQWCLMHEVTITILMAISTIRLRRALQT